MAEAVPSGLAYFRVIWAAFSRAMQIYGTPAKVQSLQNSEGEGTTGLKKLHMRSVHSC